MHLLHIYHQLKYSSTNRSNKQKDKRHTKQPIYLSGNGGFEKKRSGQWARSKKGNSDRTRQKNKTGDIEQWNQTDSPEIPDRGETSEIPRPPFGVKMITLLTIF